MPRKRNVSPPISDEERRLREEAFWHEIISEGVEMFGYLSKALGRDYETVIKFPPFEPPFCEPWLRASDRTPSSDPIPDSPFVWLRSSVIQPACCLLLVRPQNAEPLMAVACRRRFLRGDPPQDINPMYDVSPTVPSCNNADTRDGIMLQEVNPITGEVTEHFIEYLPDPPPPEVTQDLLEFCVASAEESGTPVLMPEVFSKTDRTKAIRRLAGDIRRLRQAGIAAPPE